MSTLAVLGPVGQDSKSQRFSVHLNELVEDIKQYLESGEGTISKKCCKMMEEAFECLEKFSLDRDTFEQVASAITARPEILQIFHDFMSKVSDCSEIDSNLSQMWVFAHGVVLGLSKDHNIAELIVKKGLLPYHIRELKVQRMISIDKVLKMSDLIILYNCASNTCIDAYHHAYSFTNILQPYLNAADMTMILHAKLILAYVSAILTDDDINKFLQLSSSSAECLITILGEASTSTNRKANGFTITELANGMNQLLVCGGNRRYLAKPILLPTVVSVLSCGNVQEQLASCKLLWNLIQDGTFKITVNESDLPVIDLLEQLKESKELNLSSLASCVLIDLIETTEIDLSSVICLMKECLKNGHYSRCSEICTKHYERSSKAIESNVLCLISAKSVFHIYRRQAFQLQEMEATQKIQSGKKFQILHQECYTNARKAIDLLCKALDGGFIDDEGSQMLDIAMIDYSRETNKLNECRRCLLCLKTAELRRSHIFPRGILERFSTGMTIPEKSKKNITHFRRGKLTSSKALSTYLLCQSCEDVLSRSGETHFSSKFLNKIYNLTDPMSPSSEQIIIYEGWLYHFCVGLIFRGFGQFFPHGYSNTSAVYNMFAQSRKYLLGTTSAKPTLPLIAILINPTEIAPDSIRSVAGFMNFSLNYPLEELSSSLPLDGAIPSTPEQIYYFLVHFGIINVIAIVDPSQEVHIASEYIIQPGGGTLHIPKCEERHAIIPKGLWTTFEQRAVEIETEHVRMSLSRLQWQEDNVLTEPSDETTELFGFMTSFNKDIKEFSNKLTPASVADIEKTLDFLPEDFQVIHRSGYNSVLLPEGHKLVLHYTFANDRGSGESVFLAVGTDDPFSLDKPYVVYHSYQPGLQIHAGFFVNCDSFAAEDFLPDKNPRIRSKDVPQITRFRDRASNVLPQIILSKGVSSFLSLLQRVQIRKNVNYDCRCPNREFCWYCRNRCDICMQIAGYDMTRPAIGSDALHTFCSETCAVVTGSVFIQPVIDFWDPTQDPPRPIESRTCALSDSHMELIYIFAEYTSPTNGYRTFDITLCRGDGTEKFPKDKIYAVCYTRHVSQQLMFEFFLTDDLNVQKLVKLSENGGAHDGFKDTADTALKMIIKPIFAIKGINDTSTLLQMYENKGKKRN